MDLKRQLTVLVLGTGVGLAGCQSPAGRGLSFFNKNDSSSLAAVTPDVSKQRFDGLSQQFAGNSPQAHGQARAGTTPLGAQRPAESNSFLASWKKTTAAMSASLSGKSAGQQAGESTASDPLRLDRALPKVGPEVHVAAARVLENQGKFNEAEGQYHKALGIASTDHNALVGLARLYDRQGNGQRAVEVYQRAIANHPTSSLAHNDLGLCFARQRQHEAALGAMRKAVELQPNSAKYRNNLATVLVESGQVDEALRQLTLSNPPAVAHYNLGYLLQQKGQRAEAVRHYQEALALDPALAPAREMLSSLSNQPGSQVAERPAPWQPAAAAPAAAPTQPAAQQPFKSVSTTYSPVESAPPPVRVAPPAVARSAPVSFHIGDDSPSPQSQSQPQAPSVAWKKWDEDWSASAPVGR